MIKSLNARLSARREENGFTLIELLLVIVILGILAAVVVFSVGGIGEKGNIAACKAEMNTIRTANEASFANGSGYKGTTADLKSAGFLATEATSYFVPTTSGDHIAYKSGVTAATTPGDCDL